MNDRLGFELSKAFHRLVAALGAVDYRFHNTKRLGVRAEHLFASSEKVDGTAEIAMVSPITPHSVNETGFTQVVLIQHAPKNLVWEKNRLLRLGA